jgi:hypothetical protein
MIAIFLPSDQKRKTFENYNKKHLEINFRLKKNYQTENFNLDDQCVLTYYKKDISSDPTIFSTIYRRNWWPVGVYRILNRVWQYPRVTKLEKSINDGLYEMIQAQLEWCLNRVDFKTAIITRYKNKRLFDKIQKDLANRSIFFQKSKKRIWVSNEMSLESCQDVLYYGDQSVIEKWDLDFKIRILSLNDIEQIKDLYYKNFDALSERNKKKTGVPLEKNQKFYQITNQYFSALEKYYLLDEDQDHIMFGLFSNNKLLAFVGARYDLSGEFQDSWVISYLKSSPDSDIVINSGLRQLWLHIFQYSESRGKIRWHTITDKTNHSKFNAFGKKLVPEIDNRYNFYTLCEIPAGAKSDIDWVYAMMGRMIHHDKDYIVRTGILKASVNNDK